MTECPPSAPAPVVAPGRIVVQDPDAARYSEKYGQIEAFFVQPFDPLFKEARIEGR